MSKQFHLYLQLPKPKDFGLGVLSLVSDGGTAHFFSGDGGDGARIVADLERVRLAFAGADGLMLSGMQPVGLDRLGRQKYIYQEWWLRFVSTDSKEHTT